MPRHAADTDDREEELAPVHTPTSADARHRDGPRIEGQRLIPSVASIQSPAKAGGSGAASASYGSTDWPSLSGVALPTGLVFGPTQSSDDVVVRKASRQLVVIEAALLAVGVLLCIIFASVGWFASNPATVLALLWPVGAGAALALNESVTIIFTKGSGPHSAVLVERRRPICWWRQPAMLQSTLQEVEGGLWVSGGSLATIARDSVDSRADALVEIVARTGSEPQGRIVLAVVQARHGERELAAWHGYLQWASAVV
jgi:hypothetical protein